VKKFERPTEDISAGLFAEVEAWSKQHPSFGANEDVFLISTLAIVEYLLNKKNMSIVTCLLEEMK
jgi:hypothetical protein